MAPQSASLLGARSSTQHILERGKRSIEAAVDDDARKQVTLVELVHGGLTSDDECGSKEVSGVKYNKYVKALVQHFVFCLFHSRLIYISITSLIPSIQ